MVATRPTDHRAHGRRLPPVPRLDHQERAWLLRIARAAVRAAAGADPLGAIDRALAGSPDPAGVPRHGMAFVTLTEGDALRGCIGRLDDAEPLGEAVAGAAFAAARQDPRFEPVREDELARLQVAVSVLGPLVRLDDLDRFRPGIDGLLVERGWDRGLLLPEVATMHGLDREDLLDAACRKAGLPAGAWRRGGVTLLRFRTTRFGGPMVERATEQGIDQGHRRRGAR